MLVHAHIRVLSSLNVALKVPTLSFVVPSFGRVGIEEQDYDFEDFVFFIPPDCQTRQHACGVDEVLGRKTRYEGIT